jgi:hypothetical protein
VPLIATLLGAALLVVDPTQASAPTPTPAPAQAASTDVPDDDAAEAETAAEPKGGEGVSPVEIIPKVELRQVFTKLDSGVSLHQSTAEVDIQFLQRVLLRYQVPALVVETPKGQVSGIGDIQFGLIGIVASNARAVAALIAGTVLDTATQPSLGQGKTQLVLGAGVAIKPYRWWLAYVLAQDQFSVAGQSGRPDVDQLATDFGSVLFGKQYNWLKLDVNTTVDFPGGAVGRVYGVAEVGSLVIGRVGLFSRASTQLVGPRLVDYSVTAGVRYLFRLEKGKPR